MTHQGRIKLQHAKVDERNVIRIDMPFHIKPIANQARALNNRAWDPKGQFLYVPNSTEHLQDIFDKFRGVAWVDAQSLFRKSKPADSEMPQGRLSIYDDCVDMLEEKLLLLR